MLVQVVDVLLVEDAVGHSLAVLRLALKHIPIHEEHLRILATSSILDPLVEEVVLRGALDALASANWRVGTILYEVV